MDLAAENKQLREEIARLRQRIKELEALLGQNSRNSNWPSSRDKSRKKKKRTRSLRQKSNKKAKRINQKFYSKQKVRIQSINQKKINE